MPTTSAPAAEPETFASPEQAVDALLAAARNNDAETLIKIFGAAGQNLVSSGDPIADKEARARFVDRYGSGREIVRDSTDHATLVVGPEKWPFPIPIVQKSGVWHFDTEAGAQEILDRRIGRNELNAMEVCRSYVEAQRDYAAYLKSQKMPVEYAQKFVSSPGMHDGLYWPVQPGEKQSPIGPQMARARAEGYVGSENGAQNQHVPYHGYFYKILTRQGGAAPGGVNDYLVRGHMTGGFALIAFPAKYRDSGVMTFVVDQNGIVYQKDLGPNTAEIAAGIQEFNPDRMWRTR